MRLSKALSRQKAEVFGYIHDQTENRGYANITFCMALSDVLNWQGLGVRFRRVLSFLRESLENGNELGPTLAYYPKYFSKREVGLAREFHRERYVEGVKYTDKLAQIALLNWEPSR